MKKVTIFLFFMVFGVSCNHDSPFPTQNQENTSNGFIMGYVRDSGSLDYLNNVQVKLNNKSVLTNSNGIYYYGPIEAGEYTLDASYTGYYSGKSTIIVNNGDTSLANFFLNKIITNGQIIGYVRDISTLNFVGNATVQINSAATTTNASGYYKINGVPTGNYSMSAYTSGYDTTYLNVSIEAPDTLTVNFWIKKQ